MKKLFSHYFCLILFHNVWVYTFSPSKPNNPSGLWFTTSPQSRVALSGTKIILNCLSNINNVDVTWFYHDSLLKPTYSQFVQHLSSISFVLHKDTAGPYKCLICEPPKNESSSVCLMSHPAEVSLAFLDYFQASANMPAVMNVVEGNDVVIACPVPRSNPRANIQFLKDGVPITSARNANFHLIINANQQKHNGSYSCSATNSYLPTKDQKRFSGILTTLTINFPSTNSLIELTSEPLLHYDVLIGSNLSVPCMASGFPKPQVVWTHTGSDSQLMIVNSPHGCLKLTRAQSTDAGEYVCAILNGARKYVRHTTIRVLQPPSFHIKPSVLNGDYIIQGSTLVLHCKAVGIPVPVIYWLHNGKRIIDQNNTEIYENDTLHIYNVKSFDAGIYQCVANNTVGFNSSAVYVRIEDDLFDRRYNEDDNVDATSFNLPSKPIVSQASPDSALLKWSLLTNRRGMAVKFFRIQYRRFEHGVRSIWLTSDEIIDKNLREFEVVGLEPQFRYRFRIVAVYENLDNRASVLSKRFRLRKKEPSRVPRTSPVITSILPLSETSLHVGWKMNLGIESSVEGYFINYRQVFGRRRIVETELFPGVKITIIGNSSHSYIIENLKPGTQYEIKVRAFNLEGTSPFSRAWRQATLEKDTFTHELTTNKTLVNSSRNKEIHYHYLSHDDAEITMYLTIGGVLAGLVLTLVIFCSVLSCIQKNRAQNAFPPSTIVEPETTINEPVHDSGIINSEHLITTNPVTDNNLYEKKLRETSFTITGRRSSMIEATEDLTSRIYNRNGVALNVEEYADEPTKLSWRRRKNQDIL